MLNALGHAANHQRPPYPLPSFVTREEPLIGYHVNIGPVVESATRVEAIWMIDELIEHLGEMRSAFLVDDDTSPASDERYELVGRLRHILSGDRSVVPNALKNARRTHVLNMFSVVGDLRLPAVLRRLASEGVIRADLLEEFFQPLVAEDHTCVVALVRARYPTVGDDVDRMETLSTELLKRWRGDTAQGGKWLTALELMEEIGLWDRSAKAGDPAQSMRSTYQRDTPAYLGYLEDFDARQRVWGLISEYLISMGLGSVPRSTLEIALSHVKIEG